MELVEPIERINYWLKREFGCHINGSPNWRVVFSEDQYEKRWMTHTETHLELINPEVRETKKYPHIKERYILEHYIEIPPGSDLVVNLSYEVIWTFEDRHGNYLPPRIDACKFVIEQVMENMMHIGHKKYKEDLSPEAHQEKLDKMEAVLFGNETPVGDALAHKFGVTDFHEKVEFPVSEEKKETIQ
jgi:hypothetical protein